MSKMITMRDRRVAEIMENKRRSNHQPIANQSWATLKKIGARRVSLNLYDADAAKDVTPLRAGAWEGQRCFILGGGPSLKGFDFSLLRDERTIGINRAFEYIDCDIMFSMDSRFFAWVKSGKLGPEAQERFETFQGLKVGLRINPAAEAHEGVSYVPVLGEDGISSNISAGIYHGGNSGYAALNLAVALGANPIYLLGFDMHGDEKGRQAWFHEGYPENQGDHVYKDFRKHFENIAPAIAERGTRVVNLTPGSALKCFPHSTVDRVLTERPVIHRSDSWMLTSFYTTGTGYEEEIEKLKSSAAALNIPLHAFGCPAMGSWRENLNHKSASILRAFDMFPGMDIVFVDSDALIRKRPVLFDELSRTGEYDIAAHFHPYNGSVQGGSLLSGTLWFRNSDRGKRLVRRWHSIGLSQPRVRHQHCLRLAIGELGLEGVYTWIYRLPREYTQIFDYYTGSDRPDPVIEHFQASRRLRNEVGNPEPLLDSSFTAADLHRKGLSL